MAKKRVRIDKQVDNSEELSNAVINITEVNSEEISPEYVDEVDSVIVEEPQKVEQIIEKESVKLINTINIRLKIGELYVVKVPNDIVEIKVVNNGVGDVIVKNTGEYLLSGKFLVLNNLGDLMLYSMSMPRMEIEFYK